MSIPTVKLYMQEELRLASILRALRVSASIGEQINDYLADHVEPYSKLAFTFAACPDEHIVEIMQDGRVADDNTRDRFLAYLSAARTNAELEAVITSARGVLVEGALYAGNKRDERVAADVGKLFK